MAISNNQIQAGLISKLKNSTALTTGSAVTANEVREDQWQGTQFNYPNVRVRLLSNTPVESVDSCRRTRFTVSFLVFSEDSSSLESGEIAGIINTELHNKQFTSNNIAFSLTTTNVVPSIRSGISTWRSEVLMRGLASQVG